MDQMDQNKHQAEEEDIKELLEENLELNKENHELLMGMAKRARWSFIFNTIKWVVIIGSAFGLYYYFGQFFGSTINMYKDLLGEDVASSTQSKLLQLEDKVKRVFDRI